MSLNNVVDPVSQVVTSLTGHVPQVEVDDTEVQAKGSSNAGRNHASPAGKDMLQFATGVERVDLTTRRDTEQDLAQRAILDRNRSGTQTGKVDSDQIGRRLHVLADVISGSTPVQVLTWYKPPASVTAKS